MPFLKKVHKKEITNKFVSDIVTMLEHWITMISPLKIIADTVANYSLVLRKMNNDINYLRKNLQALRLEYERIVTEYEIDPIIAAIEDAALVSEIEKALAKARNIAYSYNETLNDADKQHVNISAYLTSKNRQAIDRLFHMTTEDLLSLLKDVHLLGF